ncbi:hypothetical protein [Streptomyces sp. MNU89]|uniref:hypothetical protein n=1 Tax=Streptomyces sp. MNU89 TaxID=2560025 RepID=UPI001E4463E5|nr:hypothetical protein [Streptomyces sp. MNU89]MCC9737650.1 hypothetical protein [Streptomyces sp. MNU89]
MCELALDQCDAVGVLRLDKVAGALAPRVQGAEGDDAAGQVEVGQHRLEGGAVLVGDLTLVQGRPPLRVITDTVVDRALFGGARAAQDLAAQGYGLAKGSTTSGHPLRTTRVRGTPPCINRRMQLLF